MSFEDQPTATAAPAEARRQSKRRIVLLSLVLLGVLAAAFYPSTPVLSPPITLLPLSYKIVLPKPRWTEAWIPTTWGWLWRIHDSILGRPKATLIRIHVFQIDSDMSAFPSPLGLRGSALTGPGGVCAWAVSNADWPGLVHRLESIPGESSISSPQALTGDRSEASMFIGSVVTNGGVGQRLGLTTDFLPCMVNGMTEMTFVLSHTETAIDPSGASFIRTNFAAAARLRLTGADAAVLIDATEPQSVRTRAGLLISTQPQAR
jgi:hypothetical protein